LATRTTGARPGELSGGCRGEPKAKATVAEAAEYADQRTAHDKVAPPVSGHKPGSEPALWPLLLLTLAKDGLSTTE